MRKQRKKADVRVGRDYLLLAHAMCFDLAIRRLIKRRHDILFTWAKSGKVEKALDDLEIMAGETWNLAEKHAKA
jgi:hypothetical protein